MKGKTKGVMDRPVTLKSGVALQSHYSVQHRSDILMEEQTETVRKAQEDLKKALASLETAKGEENVDQCRTTVQEAKEKSEKAIVVLQILTKVNTELAFARAELDEALEKQEGDINEARKRVMWLEDRMGLMCGKARLRGQAYEKPKSKSLHRSPDRSVFRSRLGSDSDKSSEDSYKGGAPQRMGRNMSMEYKSDITHHRDMYTPSESGSDYPQQTRVGMSDTPSSGVDSLMMEQQKMHQKGRGLDDSDSDSDDGMPPMQGMPPGLQGMPGMPSFGQASLKSALKKQDSDSDSEDESQSQSSPVGTQPYSDSQVTQSVRYEDEVQRDSGEERSDSKQEETPEARLDEDKQESHDNQQEEEEKTVQEKEQGEADEEADSEGERTVDREKSDVSESSKSYLSESTQSHPEREVTFNREVSVARSVTIKVPNRGRRRVTFRDDIDADGDPMALMIIQPENEDMASNYWYSEHHRFEYSEYSDVLCEIDPLSYHSVGLAVPGSFIGKPERSFEDLPWKPQQKGSEINDIHKIALDKLAGRVHTMYDKLYDAAMLSVRSQPAQEGRRETTMMSFDNREGARSVTPIDGRPGMYTAPPTTADGMSRPQTVTVQPPKVDVPMRIRPGLNVYHPKPIPPPQMLPLTRISKDKTFPRLKDSFFDEDDFLPHKPAIRIVDQRNLYKETKLKLYREPPPTKEEGPSSIEKKFRMMLEQEKSMASKSSRSSRQTTPDSSRSSSANNREESPSLSMVSKSVSIMGKSGPGTRMSMSRALTKGERSESETGASTWSKIKPSSKSREFGGLKWERVKTIVHVSLVSRRPDERRDAAKHLGLLRCGDAMVFYALKERLRVDEDSRVKYEAAKSLILLGSWEEDVVQVILKYLVLGNSEIRQDLIRNMMDGKNIQYANKKTQSFPELVKVLSHFCRNPDPDDPNAFDAAILLGKLCVMDENAKFKLLRTLDHSSDTHVKAKALEVLVKQLNCTSWEVVQHILSLFKDSPVWKYRALAADLLIILGKEHVCKPGEEERIYNLLERKLWDDPTRDVKIASAKALAALGMFGKACDRIEKRLEDVDEDIRAQAVISVGTLEMKNEKIIRLLLEMLELDASEYVRLMIARTFATLQMTDKRIMRALRERDKVEGALSRESRKALKVLESLATQGRLTSPISRRSMGSRGTPRGTPRGMTPRYTPAVTA